MKKLVAALLVAGMAVSLTACGNGCRCPGVIRQRG